ncbi:MAG: polyprenyl diphosphate synthase [Gammaproteobacteria bacterium]|nr:polyprenyl diphosphate synthase [Gammaproteobacteria bacterium]
MSRQETSDPSARDKAERGKQTPIHVAMIMDGNGRWAQLRQQPREEGHRAGVETVRRVIQACHEQGVTALTLFAFSSENWRRPAPEVNALMALFASTLALEQHGLNRNGTRLRVIGEREQLPSSVLEQIRETESLTSGNTTFHLTIAANYGGRWDIVQACRKLAEATKNDLLNPSEIDEALLARELMLHDLRAPDLLIRTGGESRISNFLLWQLAYAELYFTDTLWPDFSADELSDSLIWYRSRMRRFGQTSEQIQAAQTAAKKGV